MEFIPIEKVLTDSGRCRSRSQARRLLCQSKVIANGVEQAVGSTIPSDAIIEIEKRNATK